MRATASRRPLRQPAIAAAAGLAAVALVAALSMHRAWDPVEAKFFDFFTSWSAPGRNTEPIVILGIDEPTFQQLRLQWPFPRSLHGRVLERVRADGARAVGFDIVFAEPSAPEQDEAFARSIATAGGVVLASTQELIVQANASLWTQVPPLPELIAAGAVAGDISVRPDDDYVVRRQSSADDSLSAEMARLGGRPPVAGEARPDLIQYLGPRGTIDTRSYYQALEPGLLPPGFFKDKLVLVGRSTRSAAELRASRQDMYNSPLAVGDSGDRLFPGVEIQATMLANRLSGGGLYTVSPAWGWLIVAVLGPLLFVAGRRLDPGEATAVAGACALAVMLLSFGLFHGAQRWLAPLFPVTALVALHAAAMLVAYLATRKRALQVRAIFAQYVPPPVVARLVEEPDLVRLHGETREVTLMFTDLAGFTSVSEKLTAEQTVELLTAYFEVMTPIIHRHQGTVDKFIGDAIMAFWGAPLEDAQHAEHAVRAAIEMQAAMEGLAASLVRRGLPPVSMRIGVHTGSAVIGDVGSAIRSSYTAIGDAVNLAARLEGANKAFGTGILLSGATAAQLPADIGLKPLADVIVKGKSEPVRVYTPCDDEAERLASQSALRGASPIALDKL